MGLTLNGIRSIGSIIGQLAANLCEGKVVDFIGSGYSDSLETVSLGWLASIAGVTGIQTELAELSPVPQAINPSNGLKEAATIVKQIKNTLAHYWQCFG